MKLRDLLKDLKRGDDLNYIAEIKAFYDRLELNPAALTLQSYGMR